MGQSFQIFDLVFFGLIAVFVLLRLRNVLGTRTGHEKRPEDLITRRQAGMPDAQEGGIVIALPQRGGQEVPADAKLAQALTEIKLADQRFDTNAFVDGARQAYEIIITAFARGDTDTLHAMLGEEVFANFAAAITARQAAGQTMETRLTRIREARIVEAVLLGKVAEVTVKFAADLVSITRSADGAALSGHPSLPQEATELWSFSRDTASADPNWTLVATAPA